MFQPDINPATSEVPNTGRVIISDTQLMKNKGRGVSGFHILRSLLQIIQNGFKLTAHLRSLILKRLRIQTKFD